MTRLTVEWPALWPTLCERCFANFYRTMVWPADDRAEFYQFSFKFRRMTTWIKRVMHRLINNWSSPIIWIANRLSSNFSDAMAALRRTYMIVCNLQYTSRLQLRRCLHRRCTLTGRNDIYRWEFDSNVIKLAFLLEFFGLLTLKYAFWSNSNNCDTINGSAVTVTA